jgi:hypothetical protein
MNYYTMKINNLSLYCHMIIIYKTNMFFHLGKNSYLSYFKYYTKVQFH